ncbi:MAG TPA: DUF4432 family protein [Jiangellaceae bacterium]
MSPDHPPVVGRWRPRRNWGPRVHEITYAGMRAVVLENERLRVTVLADKGADVVEFNDKRRDLDYVWLSPIGLRNPADVAGGGTDDVATFVDSYEGGWQEIFPSGGAPSTYRGVKLAQHDEVAGLAWDYAIVADGESEVAVTFTVHGRRMPFRVSRTLRLGAGEPALEVREETVNDAPVDLPAMWGQHVVFGRPFLRPGCRITLPDGANVIPHPDAINPPHRLVAPGGPWRWPEVPGPDGGTVDLSLVGARGEPSDIVYLTGFTEGWYEVRDPGSGTGLRVAWDARVLPYLWRWQELGASEGYPWWGRIYTVGLEPFSSYPTNGLAEAVANGSALNYPAGERKSLEWSITLLG